MIRLTAPSFHQAEILFGSSGIPMGDHFFLIYPSQVFFICL